MKNISPSKADSSVVQAIQEGVTMMGHGSVPLVKEDCEDEEEEERLQGQSVVSVAPWGGTETPPKVECRDDDIDPEQIFDSILKEIILVRVFVANRFDRFQSTRRLR